MVFYEDELYHYGRLGMKWYQHIFGDMDLRAKYNQVQKALKERGRQAQEVVKEKNRVKRELREDRLLSTNPSKLRGLSEEEIRKRMARLKLEEEYRNLVNSVQGKSNIEKGKNVSEKFIEAYGKEVAAGYGKKVGEQMGKEYMDKREKKLEAREKGKETRKKIRKYIGKGIGWGVGKLWDGVKAGGNAVKRAFEEELSRRRRTPIPNTNFR